MKVRVTRKQLHFIGFLGVPYFLFGWFVASKLTEYFSFGFIVLIPYLIVYDRYSQLSYIAKVHTGKYGNGQYAIRSLLYQTLFICSVTLLFAVVERIWMP